MEETKPPTEKSPLCRRADGRGFLIRPVQTGTPPPGGGGVRSDRAFGDRLEEQKVRVKRFAFSSVISLFSKQSRQRIDALHAHFVVFAKDNPERIVTSAVPQGD